MRRRAPWQWTVPEGAEVVPGTRGTIAPVANYRLPSGGLISAPALQQGLMDAVRGVGYAGGLMQDPNAPQGYVSTEAIQRGAEGLAGSAAVGSIAARAPAGALRSGMAQKNASDVNVISPRSRELIQDIIYDKMEDADPFFIRPSEPRPGIPAARPATRDYETPSGNQVVRTPDELSVARDDIGSIEGTAYGDPQINFSEIIPEAKGKGIGSSLYRDFAEELGVPFRSDSSVSGDAAVMYEKMLPKYGYNVLRNPAAQFKPVGGYGTTGHWTVPTRDVPLAKQHVYRVEPPGMKSDEFYSNPLAGAVPLMYGAPPPAGMVMSDMRPGDRRMTPADVAARNPQRRKRSRLQERARSKGLMDR
jgi:hypothetical protein